MTELISLEQIVPNPYQPREREDPEHVAKIAASIRAQGLIQTPVGRRVNSHVELAVGNTRFAAFRVNGEPAMPVDLRELTDLEMFELSIRENIDRKDLTPVEQAKAMRTYREQFGKTSAQIGELFGLSESAVRNKMRLIELPEIVQNHLTAGRITEGQARDLLTVQRVASAEQVVEIANQVVKEPNDAARYIGRGLENVKGAVTMWPSWHNGDPKGGDGLWPLTWTLDKPASVAWKDFQKFWKGPELADLRSQFERAVSYVIYKDAPAGPTNQMVVKPATELVQEAVDHLMHPPACTACPFYARYSGAHYCGAKVCWDRKREVWAQAELMRLNAELGIAIYRPEQDGTVFEDADDWNRASVFEKWVKDKAGFLRLRIKTGQYDHRYTKSTLVQLISVGDASIRHIKKEQAAKKDDAQTEKNRQEAEAERTQKRNQVKAFLTEVATPIFAQAFKPLKRGVLLSLYGQIIYGAPDDDQDAAQALVEAMFSNWRMIDNRLWYDGPVVVAEHLQGVAKSWGLELPADWMQIAQRYES